MLHNNQQFDEIRVYEGIAERTGTTVDRQTIRRSPAACSHRCAPSYVSEVVLLNDPDAKSRHGENGSMASSSTHCEKIGSDVVSRFHVTPPSVDL